MQIPNIIKNQLPATKIPFNRDIALFRPLIRSHVVLLFSLRSNIYAHTSYGSEDDARHVLSVRTARAHALIRTRGRGRAGVRACVRFVCVQLVCSNIRRHSPRRPHTDAHTAAHTHACMHAATAFN